MRRTITNWNRESSQWGRCSRRKNQRRNTSDMIRELSKSSLLDPSHNNLLSMQKTLWVEETFLLFVIDFLTLKKVYLFFYKVSSMVSQENIDQQHESKSYRIIIWVIVFVFMLLVRYALTKVAVRIQHVRDNMRGRVKPMLFWWVLLIIIFFAILFIINLLGKKEQWDNKSKNLPKSTP